MAKKMLINVVHPEESRIAIVEDGHLVELDIETAGREQTRGNIYKGSVVRVEPGLQAAFVDIGMKKLGFLQMGEIHPDNWKWRDDIAEEHRNRRPRIQEILRRGQELIVQVEKGEREGKGAALTTYISLPGRYMVLMPGSDSCGISRKVENDGDRKKIKEMVAELNVPEGYGYIIRTEALGKRKTELAKDLAYLIKLSENIKERAGEFKAPALIYQESDLVIRTIRDYFTADIEEVLVDSKDVYKQARAFFKDVMPKHEKIVKLHLEKRPIFAKYQLEEQIDLIYEKKVPLKSGGSIVIEPTEALVSIDVNSGKSTGEKGVEDTAFKTNMEAAEEVARQLRLRDLGGLIIIDFIDMRDRKHKSDVEKTLKNALKADKARVCVDKISQFGLLEMSRQRIKQTINEGSYLECPHCGGHGKVKSVEAMALSFLRKLHTAAARGTISEVRGSLPLEVAYYLLNRKKRELAQIETDYEIEVTVKGKPSFTMNQLELEQMKKEKAPHAEAEHHAEQAAAHAGEPDEGQPAEMIGKGEPAEGRDEAKSKRKRRRGKKKPHAAVETTADDSAGTGPGEAGAEREAFPGEAAAEMTGVMDETSVDSEPGTASATEETDQETTAESVKKKRRRRRKRTAKPSTAAENPPDTEADETAIADELESGAAAEPAPEPETKPAKRTRKPRKQKAAETTATQADADETGKGVSASAEAVGESLPLPVPGEQTVTKGPEGDEPMILPEEKPKRKRAPRKKKETPETPAE